MTDPKTVPDPTPIVDAEPSFDELFPLEIVDDTDCAECEGSGLEYDGASCWNCGGCGWMPVLATPRPAGEHHTIASGFSPASAEPLDEDAVANATVSMQEAA